MKLAIATTALSFLFPAFLAAQDDPDDAPLGDVARNLRKSTPSSEDVIDNDNLSHVMDDAQSRHLARTSFLYSIFGGGKNFQVSAPDVTCSLAFSGKTKSLLSSQYVQLDLPPSEVAKLEGPASVDGDSLAVTLFNGTDWHVSEVAIALTIVKRAEAPDMALYFGPAKLVPTTVGASPQEADGHSEKRSDVTVLYRIRAGAPPSETTVFRTPLNTELSPDQEWHWAIVQAKGYPPQHAASDQTSRSSGPALLQSAPIPAQTASQNTPTAAPLEASQNPPLR